MLGDNTLGIEITIQHLENQCRLGNIDPQHRGDRNSSAIKEAMNYPLPPDGAWLVTVRPDRDAFGSMAIFTLRDQGKKFDGELIDCIEIVDSMGFKNALKASIKVYERRNELTVLQKIVNGTTKYQTIEEKVFATARIFSGKMPENEIAEIAMMKHAWKNGKEKINFKDIVEMHGKVAFIGVVGHLREARDWANQYYPIAVIFDLKYDPSDKIGAAPERWTIIRQNGYLDRERFEKLINSSEAEKRNVSIKTLKMQGLSWGGPKNIVSSPQGECSLLTKEEILEIVGKCC